MAVLGTGGGLQVPWQSFLGFPKYLSITAGQYGYSIHAQLKNLTVISSTTITPIISWLYHN
jgi:hypothetical protein